MTLISYGWDWGPILMTVGPWKPVLLHTYESRISDLDIRTAFNGDHIDLTVNLTVSPPTPGEASFALASLDKRFKADIDEDGHAKGSLRLNLKDVELWYPVGYGKQWLYELEASVRTEVRFLPGVRRGLLTCARRMERRRAKKCRRSDSGMRRSWKMSSSTRKAVPSCSR
jgi:hypothetical protein